MLASMQGVHVTTWAEIRAHAVGRNTNAGKRAYGWIAKELDTVGCSAAKGPVWTPGVREDELSRSGVRETRARM